ncbi:hypothetical protein AAKU64_004228 [Undibacterium sp. GrIS 1.8]
MSIDFKQYTPNELDTSLLDSLISNSDSFQIVPIDRLLF